MLSLHSSLSPITPLFFFHDSAPTEIYTLSLHDALPICLTRQRGGPFRQREEHRRRRGVDRLLVIGPPDPVEHARQRSEEHTSELQSQSNLVCRLLLEKKKSVRRRITGFTCAIQAASRSW